MTFPLVRDLAAEGIPVRLSSGVLGFSPQAFYKWRARPCSERDRHDAVLTNAIVDVHADDPEFGYRLIADELEAAGRRAGERRVWRLCSEQRIWSTTTQKGRRGSGKVPGPAVHDDLVRRQFSAPAPDVVSVTGITLLAAAEERVRPTPLANPSRAVLCRHRLDRAHLQPPAPSTRPGQAHPGRVRARLLPAVLRGGMISYNHRRPNLQQTPPTGTGHDDHPSPSAVTARTQPCQLT